MKRNMRRGGRNIEKDRKREEREKEERKREREGEGVLRLLTTQAAKDGRGRKETGLLRHHSCSILCSGRENPAQNCLVV